MENKILLFGLVFALAFLILGCTGAEETEEMAETQPAETAPVQEQPRTVPTTQPVIQAPVYEAPLTGSTDKSCVTDDDCVLVRYRTGIGELEECMGPKADYEGAPTDECICKQLGEVRQDLPNGTEIVTRTYECKHS